MTLETLKTVFEVGGLVLILFTFLFGGGAWYTTRELNKQQEAQLRKFDRDLTEAKTELSRQQERAARAEEAQKHVELELSRQKERTANAEKNVTDLQVYASPRWLNAKKLGDAMRPFAGTAFIIKHTTEAEPERLAGYISMGLQMAGWKVVGSEVLSADTTWAGLEIESAQMPQLGDSPNPGKAAKALFEYLGNRKTYMGAVLKERGQASANVMIVTIWRQRIAWEPPAGDWDDEAHHTKPQK
jgi:hypothetical protein